MLLTSTLIATLVLAFATISNDLLAEEPAEEPQNHHYHCALAEVPAAERGGS